MKKRRSSILSNIAFYLAIIVLVAFVGGLIGLEIYCWVEYGGKSVNEIPAWVCWFLFRR